MYINKNGKIELNPKVNFKQRNIINKVIQRSDVEKL